MTRGRWAILALAAAVLVARWLLFPSTAPTTVLPETANPPAAQLPVPPVVPSDPPAPEKSSLEIPSSEVLVAESKENPHSAPPSLMEFAESLAPKLDEALASPTQGERFFGEVAQCSLKEETTPGVRALCLRNAFRLVEAYPQLRPKLDELEKKIDREIWRLAK